MGRCRSGMWASLSEIECSKAVAYRTSYGVDRLPVIRIYTKRMSRLPVRKWIESKVWLFSSNCSLERYLVCATRW